MKLFGQATTKRVLWTLAMSTVIPNRHRQPILRRLGLKRMDHSFLGPHITMVTPEEVSCGPGTFINAEVFLDRGGITLGSNVYIGPRAMLVTSNHPIGHAGRRAGDGAPDPISVGDGTWIGAGAIILPGVMVGSGCVIGAGAVVTKDCESNGLYVGVPARRIRDLPGRMPRHGE